jgi:hypothetical protein
MRVYSQRIKQQLQAFAKEIEVLESSQHTQVEHYARHKECSAPWNLIRAVDKPGQREVQGAGEQQ